MYVPIHLHSMFLSLLSSCWVSAYIHKHPAAVFDRLCRVPEFERPAAEVVTAMLYDIYQGQEALRTTTLSNSCRRSLQIWSTAGAGRNF